MPVNAVNPRLFCRVIADIGSVIVRRSVFRLQQGLQLQQVYR